MKFPYTLFNVFSEEDIEILDGGIYKYDYNFSSANAVRLFAIKPLTIFRLNSCLYFHRPKDFIHIKKGTIIQMGPYKTGIRELTRCRILNELEMYDWIYYREEYHD